MTKDDALQLLRDLDKQLNDEAVDDALENQPPPQVQAFNDNVLQLENLIERLETAQLADIADALDQNADDLKTATQEAKASAKELGNIAKVIGDIAKVITVAGKIAAHI